MFNLFVPSIAGGDEAKAKELAKEISALNKARGLMAQALIQIKNKEQEAALESFSNAAELGKDDLDVNERAVKFFLDSGNHEKAGKIIDHILTLKPGNAQYISFKGDYFSAKEEYSAAIEQYNNALAINPDFMPAWLKRGLANKKGGNNEAAKKDFQHLTSNHPKSILAVKAKKELDNL